MSNKLPTYRIKGKKTKLANGQIMHFDLLQDGEWLESFATEEEAEAEMAHRLDADYARLGLKSK